MRAGPLSTPDAVEDWLQRLEHRQLADLRLPEVARALRALSSAYVERREVVRAGRTLDSAGKRAAFALFYAPIHFLVTTAVVEALELHRPAPRIVMDLGCGTGAAGAAWALACEPRPRVLGLDRHPWAVEEARQTYRDLRVDGRARTSSLDRPVRLTGHDAIVAAYVLNELTDDTRTALIGALRDAASEGATVLVLEPISRAAAPWWGPTAAAVVAGGGRADEWRFRLERPGIVERLDQATGLDHREVKVRTLVMRPTGRPESPAARANARK